MSAYVYECVRCDVSVTLDRAAPRAPEGWTYVGGPEEGVWFCPVCKETVAESVKNIGKTKVPEKAICSHEDRRLIFRSQICDDHYLIIMWCVDCGALSCMGSGGPWVLPRRLQT